MRKIDRQIERLPKNGSYRKRLDDAFAAIEICSPEALPPLSAFILYYLTCEKLAKVVLGIKRGKPGAGDEFNNIKVRSSEIIEACRFIGLRIPSSELYQIPLIRTDVPNCAGRST